MKQLFLSVFVILFWGQTFASDDEPAYTRDLDGSELAYTYPNGLSFGVKFEQGNVRFKPLRKSNSGRWFGPFAYKAIEIADDVYMAAWFEKGIGDYVTLVINFNDKLVYGSAYFAKDKSTMFHAAKLAKVER